MGYSQPKKQLDLKEFLSTPAKKRPYNRKFGTMKPQAATSKPTATSAIEPDDAAS
ncbi:hypothetical protein SAMN04488105_14311 [Salipiger thiooxidans]|uniref:Uncharacterized protein n=1 Tax=Salipiger thiooxidans TaxID=282683 RepID=A0A1G7MW19_9RHOB|nr:hypothetical protein [Salipiger thiooxidans]SDF65836.1 hypothetical protein SAMN04488105_14311 [Salipiger thiooxidans]